MSLKRLVLLKVLCELGMVACFFWILSNFAGCGSDNLLAEGHYRTSIHWTHSDWSGVQLPPDDVQVWTLTGDDKAYRLVLPGSDDIVHGYETKGYALFTLGTKANAPGELSPFLQVQLFRSSKDKDDGFTGKGEACAWIGYAMMCERVEVNSIDFAEID